MGLRKREKLTNTMGFIQVKISVQSSHNWARVGSRMVGIGRGISGVG